MLEGIKTRALRSSQDSNLRLLNACNWATRALPLLQPPPPPLILVSSPDLILCVYRFQYNAILKPICAGVGFGSGTETTPHPTGCQQPHCMYWQMLAGNWSWYRVICIWNANWQHSFFSRFPALYLFRLCCGQLLFCRHWYHRQARVPAQIQDTGGEGRPCMWACCVCE